MGKSVLHMRAKWVCEKRARYAIPTVARGLVVLIIYTCRGAVRRTSLRQSHTAKPPVTCCSCLANKLHP